MSVKQLWWWIAALCAANLLVWGWIAFGGPYANAFYFFDVGQGDSSLIRAGRASFLIDTGKGRRVLDNLAKALPTVGGHIDVLMISHPQLDHSGGVLNVVGRYPVGIVIWAGQKNALWDKIENTLNAKSIPYAVLAKGDSISYGSSTISVLWPPRNEMSADLNDTSMVERACLGTTCALFTGDIPSSVEDTIATQSDIKSAILKVSHHGSKYSSAPSFLLAVDPAIAVVEVGKNSYGHPTKQALSRIADVGARLFRTDRDGMIEIRPSSGTLDVFKLSTR